MKRIVKRLAIILGLLGVSFVALAVVGYVVLFHTPLGQREGLSVENRSQHDLRVVVGLTSTTVDAATSKTARGWPFENPDRVSVYNLAQYEMHGNSTQPLCFYDWADVPRPLVIDEGESEC